MNFFLATAALSRLCNTVARSNAAQAVMLLFAATVGLAPRLAAADVWPAKPVTIIVPYAAGGTVDKVARQIQDDLSKRLGQPVVIDNRAGGGGTIGTGLIARAAPDGYTIGMVFDGYATEPYFYPQLPYSHQDLVGVSYMVRSPMVLVVPAASPYKTLRDYAAAAHEPDKVSFASVGTGSSNHLVAEAFHELAGTSGIHAPYKGGGPAMTDLMGNHVDSMFASLPLVLPYVQSGKLRALAITSRERDPKLPDVPTVSELYQKDFEAYSWVAMIASAKIPPDILGKLTTAVTAMLHDPAIVRQMTGDGFQIMAGDSAQTDKLMEEESARWGRLIKARHITIQ